MSEDRKSYRSIAAVGTIIAISIWLVCAVWPGVARCWEPPTDCDPRKPITQCERAIVEKALECNRASKRNRDPFLLLELLRLEKQAGVPSKHRGMILAAACHETGYNYRLIGDGGLAVGLTQLHWYHRRGKGCVLDNDVPPKARIYKRTKWRVPDSLHPIGNALCWLTRVRQAAASMERKGCAHPWLAGWGWIARGRRCCSCYSHRHLARLKRWKREIFEEHNPVIAMPHLSTWGSDEPF